MSDMMAHCSCGSWYASKCKSCPNCDSTQPTMFLPFEQYYDSFLERSRVRKKGSISLPGIFKIFNFKS